MPYKDPRKYRRYQRRYWKKHPSTVRVRAWRKANPEKSKAIEATRNRTKPAWLRLKRLTQDEYDAKLRKQRNRCALCRKPFTKKNPPVVDHDHATEKDEGLAP